MIPNVPARATTIMHRLYILWLLEISTGIPLVYIKFSYNPTQQSKRDMTHSLKFHYVMVFFLCIYTQGTIFLTSRGLNGHGHTRHSGVSCPEVSMVFFGPSRTMTRTVPQNRLTIPQTSFSIHHSVILPYLISNY